MSFVEKYWIIGWIRKDQPSYFRAEHYPNPLFLCKGSVNVDYDFLSEYWRRRALYQLITELIHTTNRKILIQFYICNVIVLLFASNRVFLRKLSYLCSVEHIHEIIGIQRAGF